MSVQRIAFIVLAFVVPIGALVAVFVLFQPSTAPHANDIAAAIADTQATTAPAATALPVPTTTPQPPTATPAPTDVPTPTAGPLAPELIGGGAWINSEPLTLAELRGKVVLVNFWTHGCYNCRNTLPYVKQWWDKYQGDDFVIIGVHTPEFAYEADLANVQAFVNDDGITWPVVLDNDKQIWRAYENRYWPRFYLIDKNGSIVYDHIGEGGYDETDQQIAAALAQ